MNKIYLFFTFIIMFVSCTSRTNNIDQLENNNKINQDSTSSILSKEIKQEVGITNFSPDFNLFTFVFDTLSQDEKKLFIHNNQEKIDLIVSSNFGKYSQIKEIDSIFDILVSCRIDSIKQRELVPFDIFVLTEISNNKHADGYLGEFITDMYYHFFRKYPGYFYQYMNFLDSKSNYKGLKKRILYKVIYGFYLNDMNKDDINTIFNEHRKMLEKNETQINSIEQYIIKHLKDI